MNASTDPLSYDDRWLRVIGISVLTGLFGLAYFTFNEKPVTATTWQRWLADSVRIGLFWELNRWLIRRLRSLTPRSVRILATVGAGVTVTALLNSLFHIVHYALQHHSLVGLFTSFDTTLSISINNRQSTSSYLVSNLLNSIFPFLLFYGLYEVYFLVQETRYAKARLLRAEQEKALLEKATLQSQLEALKQQVNPHRSGDPVSL